MGLSLGSSLATSTILKGADRPQALEEAGAQGGLPAIVWASC